MNRVNDIVSISKVFEKTFQPLGNGLVGFTMFFANEEFENHIRFYDIHNHVQVVEEVARLHQRLSLAICDQNLVLEPDSSNQVDNISTRR